MKKIILYTIVIVAVLIMSSIATIAKQDTAPGQRRKNYDTPREFVLSVLKRNLERIQSHGVNPWGLLRLVNELFLKPGHNDEPNGEDEDDELEVDAKGDYEGIIGELIEFEGYAKGGVEPYNWSWSFGDGNTSTEQSPNHSYMDEGEFIVNLTVTDANGSTASDETLARIENDFEVDAGGDYDGLVGEFIQFEGKAENGIEPYNWSWNFGDSNVSSEQNPQHTYTSLGNYTATLTVIDDVGNVASDNALVYITDE
jgi:chitodextrinase